MRVTSFAARPLAGLAALACAAACGASRPPTLGDTPGGTGGGVSAGGGTFDDDGGVSPDSCDLGPDRGVCACSDITLLSDVPTLYFVLDRSGSMREEDRWTTVRTVVASVIQSLGPRARVGITVFPGLGTQGPASACATGDEVLAVRAGDAPAGARGATYKAAAESVGGLAAVGGTPTAATLRGVLDRLTRTGGRKFVVLATDGGPNCNANTACDVDGCILNIEHVEPCNARGPRNCCADAPEQCLDGNALVGAVDALRGAGIPTYVIGVPGSLPYADLLDRAAQAGGTARDASPRYYRVDTSDEAALTAALRKVAAKVTATCELTLADVPDPTRVNVFLDNVILPQDPNDGWVLEDKTVRLVGRACARVTEGDALAVRVVAGCPTVAPR